MWRSQNVGAAAVLLMAFGGATGWAVEVTPRDRAADDEAPASLQAEGGEPMAVSSTYR